MVAKYSLWILNSQHRLQMFTVFCLQPVSFKKRAVNSAWSVDIQIKKKKQNTGSGYQDRV